MRKIKRPLDKIPIEELGLRHSLYKKIKELGAYTVQDMLQLPEEVLIRYYPALFEGLERVQRHHVAPY